MVFGMFTAHEPQKEQEVYQKKLEHHYNIKCIEQIAIYYLSSVSLR